MEGEGERKANICVCAYVCSGFSRVHGRRIQACPKRGWRKEGQLTHLDSD
jgi:hypothetical protein